MMESAVAVQMKGWTWALSNRLMGDHAEPDLNPVKPGGGGQHQMDMTPDLGPFLGGQVPQIVDFLGATVEIGVACRR